MRHALAVLITSLAGPTLAGEFLFPVDCTLGQDCFIQQYVDRDPGPEVQDFGCGGLSYDGHKGTDFALATEVEIRGDGVAVRSVAAGTVQAVRDGVPDLGRAGRDAARASGQECGNGVLIAHGDGLETQYCHLREGSVRVQPGQTVEGGAQLGLVGQSGAADFPHLHLSVRQNGEMLDPFQPDDASCGGTTDQLWQTPLPYVPTGLVLAGFSTDIPDYDALTAGHPQAQPDATASAFVLWVMGFGSLPQDQLQMTLTGPAGAVLDQTVTLDRAQARYMRAAGLRLRADRWPAGAWRGTITLTRDGQELAHRAVSITLD